MGLRRQVLGMLLGLGLALPLSPAHGQYFGRNKVQYENFDFEVLRTEHFDIYFYPEEGHAVELAALMAERWYARLSRLLNHDLSGRQPLILYASGPHFRQTNTLQGEIGEATGGVTEILKRRIVLPFSGPLPETDHVLGHELVHAFQFDITGEGGGVILAGVPAVMRFPLWFVEGMAEYLSIGPWDPNTAMWMRDAVREELPDLRKLNDPRFFPYRYGHALWAYIGGRWGDDAVGRILKASRTAGNPAMAFERVLRIAPDTLVDQWHRATRQLYEPLVAQTDSAGTVARPLFTKATGATRYSIAPALSPDGSRIVFISERGLFSIDMYLADVATGEILAKITKTDVDPHFESIQFISSAGAWDAEGRRFVFGVVSKGRPRLSIYDTQERRTAREIPLPEIGEVFNPTWSPDGRYIAFSALVGGLTDLYMYDLEQSALRRLTNDDFADLQPAWSPDGRRIAFVTDRFTTGLSSLVYGNYRIGLIDPASGTVERVPGFDTGKHINPQWSPDGRSLFFIADRNGIANVYRVDLAARSLSQVTNLYSGVSGITALSPAISVAAGSGALAMTVYAEDAHGIWLADDDDVLAGRSVQPPFGGIDPAALPPTNRLTDDVASLLGNAFYGLPEDTATYARRDYAPRLSLDYIGQPSLAVGVDRFGTFIAGGASLFWSDMLGGHNLATALQFQGTVKDIAALVGYANLNRRLNWGMAVQQIPYRYGFVDYVEYPHQGLLDEVLTIIRQINRQAVTSFAYPLSRVQRVEASAGYVGVEYDLEQLVTTYSCNAFQCIAVGDTVIHQPSPYEPLHMGQASAALVYDNSLFGVASPLLGQRYRFEATGMVGSLDLVTGLGDFRKYVMPVRPFTFATRVLHYGRYGPDEDSRRLTPIFLGYDGLVRGYRFGSFDFVNECGPSAVNCPAYTDLFGSKIVVANAELRFPPLGILGLGQGLFGFLPLEAFVFGDAGLAWWGADDPLTPTDDRAYFLAAGEREPVFSAGAGLRMNMFGIIILELDWVRPFNRPNKGGHFQFGFTPGF